jgi:uncharacterized membrane protein
MSSMAQTGMIACFIVGLLILVVSIFFVQEVGIFFGIILLAIGIGIGIINKRRNKQS